MGNKNDYLTLEDSAQALGKPTSWMKGIISRGELGAKLSGGRWLIALRDLDKLRADLPPEPETVVHKFLSDNSPPRPDQIKRSAQRPSFDAVPRKLPPAGNRNKELEMMDREVRSLVARVEVELACLSGGKAIWNKLRKDGYSLNTERRKSLPKNLVKLLEDLQRTKRRYIPLRETERYKRLLSSSPEWNLVRVAKKVGVAQTKRSKSAPDTTKAVHIGGIDGYYAGNYLATKRFWFNEED